MTKKNSILFDQEKNDNKDSRIRRDILYWYIKTIRGGKPIDKFRFTDLGNWLLENHRPFVDEFSSDRTRKSYRLQSKRTYITNRLAELISLGLIVEEPEKEKAQKNDTEVKVYSFTFEGKIMGFLLDAWYSVDISRRQNSLEMFFSEITEFLKYYPSSLAKCLVAVLDQLIIKGHCERITNEYLELFIPLFSSRSSLYLFFRHILMAGLYMNDFLSQIFLDTINSLEEEDKKYVLMQLKLDIESNYYNGMETTWDWEIKRLETISDFSTVILQGYCLDCKIPVATGMDIIKFLGLGSRQRNCSPDGSLFVTSKIICPHCNKIGSRYIIPIWYLPSEILSPNVTSIEYMEKVFEPIQSIDQITPIEEFKYAKKV